MKAVAISSVRDRSSLNPLAYRSILFLSLCLLAARPAQGGLTLSLQLSRYAGGYICYSSLATNATAPAAAPGTYVISSPTNAWSETYQLSASGMAFVAYNHLATYPDFNSFLLQLTNGSWSILVTNATSTNLYSFRMSATGFTSNSLPQVTVLFPQNNAANVTNNPTFIWQGPVFWSGYIATEDYNDDFSFFQSGFLASSQTNWNSPLTLPNGHNTFYMYYGGDASSSLVASTPTNNLSQPISGWVSSAVLNSSASSFFTVTNISGGSGGAGGSIGHTNVAWYTFEDHNLFAHDFSEKSNNVVSWGYLGGATNMPYFTNDSMAGTYSLGLDGSGYLSPSTNLVATLAGSFSVSVWARPFGIHGNDSDPASSGAGLLAANYDQVIPIALTGHKVAFETSGASTLHSTGSVTLGSYVHLVVTRDSTSGEKKIYINGVLDATGSGATGLLGTATQPNLYLGENSTYAAGFNGDLDEVQIYSGVLASNEVVQLYQNPGTIVRNADLAAALDATNLTWNTSGNATWFFETTNTYDGVSAAQSGTVTNGQTSVLSTTVTGPGTVTFWWSTQTPLAESLFDLEFDLDGGYQDDIFNNQSWVQESAIAIPGGMHTLTWTAYGANYSTDAAFVDRVSFTPATPTNVLQTAHFEIVLFNDRSISTPGGGYFANLYLEFVQPDPLTVDEVVSPSGKFTLFYTNHFNSGTSSYQVLSTWAALANECTNGLWTLYVNKGASSETQLKFAVTLNNLNTNLLSPVDILTPANGAVNVPTNSPVTWTLPALTNVLTFAFVEQTNSFGYAEDYLDAGQLPGNTTNWIPNAPMNYGTNVAFVDTLYPLPFMPASTPTNTLLNTVSNWSSDASVITRRSSTFVVGAPAPLPVQIFASSSGTLNGNFQFGLQTVAGRLEIIQISTNLTTWTDLTNFIGDGSVRQFSYAITNAPDAYFRVITQ